VNVRMHPPLGMWTVYDGPADYPGQFVARLWLIDGSPEPVPTSRVWVGGTLDEVLAKLPPGLSMLPRDESDPTSVVGTWL
jgi:hypothetical protein